MCITFINVVYVFFFCQRVMQLQKTQNLHSLLVKINNDNNILKHNINSLSNMVMSNKENSIDEKRVIELIDEAPQKKHKHNVNDIIDLDLDKYTSVEQMNSQIDNINSTITSTKQELINNINGKANVSHTHNIDNITDLQSSLDNKANASHTHSISDINDIDISNYVTTEQLDTKANEINDNITQQTSTLNESINNAKQELNNTITSTKDELTQSINNKADSSHTHNEYVTTQQLNTTKQELNNSINNKANNNHTHTISDVTDLQTTLDGKANVSHTHDIYFTKTQLVDLFYPIGSIYTSMNKTDPGTLFGGTWKRITDCFLWCTHDDQGVAGEKGGSKKITVDNLPSHNHTFTGVEMTGEFRTNNNTAPFHGGNENWASAQGVFKRGEELYSYGTNSYKQGSDVLLPALLFEATPEGTISNTGRGADYMPPYIRVYAWNRTA